MGNHPKFSARGIKLYPSHTEELNVVSDKCNGHVLPSNHVCRNVKHFECSAQCFKQVTHSIVNGLRSLTFCDIFPQIHEYQLFQTSWSKFRQVLSNWQQPRWLHSHHQCQSQLQVLCAFCKIWVKCNWKLSGCNCNSPNACWTDPLTSSQNASWPFRYFILS